MTPATDGTDHINIYSKGQTTLGRALSNLSSHRVITPDGTFASLEGYWYWLSVDPDNARRDDLMVATGWQAKQLGRDLRGADWSPDPTFKLRIVAAMMWKLILHPSILEQLTASTLPFRHYYVYGDKVVEPPQGGWIVDTWTFTRSVTQAAPP